MFRMKTFPNLMDDFLLAYEFACSLNHRWNVEGNYTNSDMPFPAIPNDELEELNYRSPHNSISLWFGNPNTFLLDNGKNFGFATRYRLSQFPTILHKMKHYLFNENFPFVYNVYNQPSEKLGVIFYYINDATRDMDMVVESYLLSKLDEPLKILAPYSNYGQLRDRINKLKAKIGIDKEILIACPGNSNPDKIRNEILGSKACVDIRTYPSVSYLSLISRANGIQCVGSDTVYPEPNMMISTRSQYKSYDGSRFSNEVMSKFRQDDLVNALDDILDDIQLETFSNRNEIFKLGQEMIDEAI